MNLKNIKEKISGKVNTKSVRNFFHKQGLYVLIFLCLAAAGITAIVAWPKDNTGTPGSPGDAGASVIDAPRLEDELAARTPVPSATQAPTASPSPSPEETTKPSPQSGSGSITLTKPTEGPILQPFSGDELVFFASMNIWATHNGVDIKAEKGADVVAAMGGTVKQAHTNEADGGLIIISHSGKTETVYAGLGEMLVKEGDKVNAGQSIGTVGEMPKELDLSYHLHFEYIVDGVWKDPAKYFK